MAGETSRLILIAGAFVAGLGAGWFGHGEWSGSSVSASGAATTAQTQVNAAAAAGLKIQAARTATETATERVRTVTRTVTVAADCPPGRGAVSADFAEQLRALAAARQSAGAGSGRVPGQRHD